ncbi:MAG: chemotaxis protein CheB [Bacteroides sp.]
MGTRYKAVVIGGSAGSFQVVVRILQSLPNSFSLPLILCLHRLKHVRTGFEEALSLRSAIPVIEPLDKENIRARVAYLAPSNYHLFVELGNRFCLSTEEVVNHSRPSIDLTFFSVARVYREHALGIILSGANRDGAMGLARLKRMGGTAIVQDPAECEVRTMTEASLQLTSVDAVLSTEGIIQYLKDLSL